ncbi:hypothetical protein K474DRAFT_1768056 [Panus rudis PR-1116 ss-1]|nr:hypothetical protein K474DRAFT_1768056 [Panus rudis PR-1116 ss-1]
MNHPTHTRPSNPHNQQIFRDLSGAPLHIFVEPLMENRPQLVRTLRNAGARISVKADEASIILVDPETKEGEALALDWAGDDAHVVLSIQWVWDALRNNAPALSHDDWGGRRVVAVPDESASQDGSLLDEEDHERRRSTPSTARHTPIARRGPIGSHVPPGQVPHMPGPINLPPPQQPLPGQHVYPMQNAFPDPNFQYLYPIPQQLPSEQEQYIVSGNLLASLLDVCKNVAGINGQPLANPNGHLWPLPGQAPHNQFGQMPGVYPVGPPPLPPVHPQGEPLAAPGIPFYPPQEFHRSSATPESNKRSPSSADRSASPDVPLASRRTSKSKGKARQEAAERPRKRMRQNYAADVSSSRSASYASTSTPRSRSKSDDGELFIEDGESISFVVQVDLRKRKDVVQNIKNHGGKIVADIADADYVVLSPHSTSFTDLLRSAVAYSRPAVQASFVHDSVREGRILDAAQYSFEGIHGKSKRGRPVLVKAVPRKGSPSKTSSPSPRKSSPLKQSLTQPKSRLKRQQEEEEEEERSDEASDHNSSPGVSKMDQSSGSSSKPAQSSKSASQPNMIHPSLIYDGRGTPSPPPPQDVRVFAPGKNYYTDAERAYVSRYLPILLRRNPDATFTALSECMHNKMPQHSVGSWQMQLTGKFRPEISNQRKKALIARRKAEAQEASCSRQQVPERKGTAERFQDHQEQPDADDEDSAREVERMAMDDLSSSDNGRVNGDGQDDGSHNLVKDIDEEQPELALDEEGSTFHDITHFFADGGADDKSDEQAWNDLAEKFPYKTAQEWQDYWDKYGGYIVAQVKKLCEAQGDFLVKDA